MRHRKSFIITVEIIQRISSSSHYSVELLEIEHSVAIPICFFKHFFQLLIWNFLSDFAGDSFQVFEGDFVQVVFVKKFEYF